MAYTTIDKGSSYFDTTAYTGNGSAGRNLTTGTFQPDWVWIKSRTDIDNHRLIDAVRGATKHLESDTTGAEQTSSNVTAFTSTGITLSSNGAVNANAETYVVWSWLGANTTASNTSGTITSTVSANTTSGFSIVSYTGNGTNGATIGHGLGVAPAMVIVKCRSDASTDWAVYHKSLTAGNMVFLNTTSASAAISSYDNGGINPVSSTTFTTAQGGVSLNNVNTSTRTYIAYCFAEVKGYSKFGSYTGNGSTDGTFIYTGFKPAFVMTKRTDSADWWGIWDSKRLGYNGSNYYLLPNTSNAEANKELDILSNGFKIRTIDGGINASGGTYIYMAFAENPFVTSTGLAVTAR